VRHQAEDAGGDQRRPHPHRDRWFKTTQATDLARRSVTLVHDPGLSVGEIVLVDELADPAITRWSAKSPPGRASSAWFMRPERPVGQVVEIASIDGSTMTFTTPLHIEMRTAFTAQLTRF